MNKNKTDKGYQPNERQSTDKNKQYSDKQNQDAKTHNMQKESKHPDKKDDEGYEPKNKPANNLTDPKRKDSKHDDDESIEKPNEDGRINKRIDTDINQAEIIDDEDLDENIDIDEENDINADSDEEQDEVDENGKKIKRRINNIDDENEETDNM
ncbi:MAG TPA: hypothetical protein PLJ00_16995 [Chitinophagales bacterium]|nr:hypothetical protein [Chitinophagales bacterium]